MEVSVKHSGVWLYVRVYTFPLLYVAQMLTIWITVVIAMNRFYAVCRPYKAPHLCRMKNVYTSVILVALFSFFFNVPRFFELSVYQTDEGVFQWARSNFSTEHLYKTIYVDVLYYIFTFVVPLLILAYV